MDEELEGFSTKDKENSASVGPKKKSGGSFQSFGLSFPILKGLHRKGYKIPTPIQRKTIPLILQGRDVVAMARTGSGKTACFLLPMFEKLLNKPLKTKFGGRALILSPTRELALQTVKFIRELGKFMNFKVLPILGGESMQYQFGALHDNPDIIVATPGRFLHVCVEMDLKLTSVDYVVFDEADRLFEMGFGDQLKEILDRLGVERQTLLFSATLPKLLVDFAKVGLINPVLLRLDVETKIPETLDTVYFSVKQNEKLANLLCLLRTLPKNSQTLIFVATKHHVEYLHKVLDKACISSTLLYSDLDPAARKINAGKFLNKVCSVLIVTDIAARGIDIPQLDFVINYHFPAKPKLFVHRVGRAARAGKSGTAFSLVSFEEVPYVLDLHLFLGKKLNLIPNIKAPEEDKDSAFGTIPSFLIEIEQSELIVWHQTDEEMSAMEKVSDNGYKKYLHSRPGASIESVKRAKKIDFNNLGIHYYFNAYIKDEGNASELMGKMKHYRPKGTIFELNLSNKSKCYSVMKKTKKAHEKYVLNFKKTVEEKELKDNKIFVTYNDLDGLIKKEMDVCSSDKTEETSEGVKKNKHKILLNNNIKVKKKKLINEEYYVPHFASDQHTEKGFSINSFTNEANKFTFELTGDCDAELTMQKRIKKWDKKRKKLVGIPDQKIGKFKTESGNWLSASYKRNLYEKWKEGANISHNDDSEDDDVERKESNARKTTSSMKNLNSKYKDFPNTRMGRYNRKMAERIKAKAGLLKPERILKARRVLEKKQQKSIPRSKRRNNKEKYKK